MISAEKQKQIEHIVFWMDDINACRLVNKRLDAVSLPFGQQKPFQFLRLKVPTFLVFVFGVRRKPSPSSNHLIRFPSIPIGDDISDAADEELGVD